MWRITTTCMQFISLCCLATIAEGILTSATVPRKSPKSQLFSRSYLDESKVYRNTKWKFHLQPKLIPATQNESFIKKRSSSSQENDNVISSPLMSSADGKSAISEDVSKLLKNDEFHVSSEMVGGGGLQLFGVTNSFVNPGALLSTTIENGLKQLSEAANSLSNSSSLVVQPTPSTTNNSPAQFFGIANGNSEGKHDFHSPLKEYPSVTNATLAQFFGIANIYVGGLNQTQVSDQSECPICPPVISVGCPAPPELPASQLVSVGCPSPPEHAILTVTVTACETLSSLGTCSVASIAQSGTLFVSYPFGISSRRRKFVNFFQRKKRKKKLPMSTVGSAVIGIVATPPNTKVSVTCPNIPPGITVTTQNGPVLPYKPREEVGFIQLLVSGTASPANVAVACVWTSIP